MKGLFDFFFDSNHDGIMNAFEQGAKFATLAEMMSETETEASYSEEELLSLAEEGLDFDELACMDEDERREVLEEVGLEPDDFDF